MKVAIVHDWLVSYRGGEKVLEHICELYPNAPIYTLFYDKKKLPPSLTQRKIIYPKLLNRFRFIRKLLLPILPSVIEAFPLWDYDLIISTSSCVAKGAIGGPYTKHLSYIHSPMRYIWDQRDEYFHKLFKLPFLAEYLHYLLSQLRVWDVVSSARVDVLIANSSFVQKRISRYYQQNSSIIHPPIAFDLFNISSQHVGNEYYLVAGAFVTYKRFDLAIKACQKLGKRLVVAGSGPCLRSLQQLATTSLVQFKVSPDASQWLDLLQNAKALIFPGVEDFGMVAIEAMACGTPVIAYKAGGALDYISPLHSGIFFTEPSETSLAAAISEFETLKFERLKVRTYAERFDKKHFLQKFKHHIDQLILE